MPLTLSPWQIDAGDFPRQGPLTDQLRFLIRYAILAPSSHNTQPWQFRVEGNHIDLFLDYEGWLVVADDDQRELHISLGCALENLLIAAEHFGLGHRATMMPDHSEVRWVVSVSFEPQGNPSPFRPPELFAVIAVRHTNHQSYTPRRIPQDILQRLESCCVEPDVSLYLTEDPSIKQTVDELVVRGDAIEFADPAFRAELGEWIGKGVFGTSWLISKLGQLAVSHIQLGKSLAKRDSALLMGSPVLGVVCTLEDDRPSQLRVGQVYERACLLAALEGIWTQPLSQIVQIPELREELAELVPIIGMVPQHPFRMGYAAAEQRHTPRRPVEEVVKQA